MTRKVNVFKAGEIDPETRNPSRELDYVGDFLQFVCTFPETDYCTPRVVAIVEKPSGDVETVLLRNLQFVKESTSEWLDWDDNHEPPLGSAFVHAILRNGERLSEYSHAIDWDQNGRGSDVVKYKIDCKP